MAAIGEIKAEWREPVIMGLCLGIAAIAVVNAIVGIWSQVNVAHVYGTEQLLRMAPLTLLPFGLTAACLAAIRILFLPHQGMVSTGCGKCDQVLVHPGDEVEPNTVICVIEVMKMQVSICAGTKGRIAEIYAQPGAMVQPGTPLFRLEGPLEITADA